jgi:hypothetical protein
MPANANRRSTDDRPIFIHAMWRTGSTYIWNKFRQQRQYRAYIEPLHESLTKPREQIIAAQTAERVQGLRHPRLDRFYFDEFPFMPVGGVEFFEKALSYERYCLEEDCEDQTLHRYICNLIAFARENGRTPVLQFNRSLLRAGWLTRKFSPINILLLRRPLNVWKSFLSYGSYSFITLFTLLLGQNQFKAPLTLLPRWVEIPFQVCDTIEMEYDFYGLIGAKIAPILYPAFFDFYVLSTIQCAKIADCILDMDELSRNPSARQSASEKLMNLGISLGFDDCSVPSYAEGGPQEREWLAYEEFGEAFLTRVLPSSQSIPARILAASRLHLSDYFFSLLTRFSESSESHLLRSSSRHGEQAAAFHHSGIDLYKAGKFEMSCRAFGDALGLEETSERWNDWAVAEGASSNLSLSELGYRQALRMDAKNALAAGNLGLLLNNLGRNAESLPYLEQFRQLQTSAEISSEINKMRSGAS